MRVMTGHEKGRTFLTLSDNGREIASASGTNAQDAAAWLMHQMDRIVEQTKKLLIDMGLDPEQRPEGR